MTRGSTIIWGNDELTRAPAPDAKHIRRDINSACSAVLPAQATPLRSMGGKTDCASIRSSMQAGSNTSPGLFASAPARPRGEDMASQYSLPRRPFLLQFAIDVAAVMFAILLVAVTGFGLAFAVFCLLFMSF